jgi:hypothetical protein
MPRLGTDADQAAVIAMPIEEVRRRVTKRRHLALRL